MSHASEAIDLDALRAAVTRQGALVRQLKKDGAEQVHTHACARMQRVQADHPRSPW